MFWPLFKKHNYVVTDSHVKFSLAVSSVAKDLRNFLKTELTDFDGWQVKYLFEIIAPLTLKAHKAKATEAVHEASVRIIWIWA